MGVRACCALGRGMLIAGSHGSRSRPAPRPLLWSVNRETPARTPNVVARGPSVSSPGEQQRALCPRAAGTRPAGFEPATFRLTPGALPDNPRHPARTTVNRWRRWHPLSDSNARARVRSPLLFPLSYGGGAAREPAPRSVRSNCRRRSGPWGSSSVSSPRDHPGAGVQLLPVSDNPAAPARASTAAWPTRVVGYRHAVVGLPYLFGFQGARPRPEGKKKRGPAIARPLAQLSSVEGAPEAPREQDQGPAAHVRDPE